MKCHLLEKTTKTNKFTSIPHTCDTKIPITEHNCRACTFKMLSSFKFEPKIDIVICSENNNEFCVRDFNLLFTYFKND